MLKSVREELNRIETFLLRKDQAAQDLAAILTALRSHDVLLEGEKDITTAPLRAIVFPRAWEADSMGEYQIQTGPQRWMAMSHPYGLTVPKEKGHFYLHHRNAVEAVRRQE